MKCGFDGCDVTSGLPDDATITMVILTTGHGQMSTSGLHDDITMTMAGDCNGTQTDVTSGLLDGTRCHIWVID